MTRSSDPRQIDLNDALGNYSLTLIDSLSTLAVLASEGADGKEPGRRALAAFQDGVEALVIQYGDGTAGKSGQGWRARGFDLDSKVQVFETVIRGVGGLVSAHLFAIGELLIRGYEPKRAKNSFWKTPQREVHPPIIWPNGFRYDGQLLRLAIDLAQRMLPAFYTKTGMPYPRVNLRHGIPFYSNSPLHENTSFGECRIQDSQEATETCSAGAGSLTLEFIVLSRLTGDYRFEQLGKRAFWAVWNRRTNIDLIGSGVDAESGQWNGFYTGIGASVDSFFEYAFKTHVLLSGHDLPNITLSTQEPPAGWLDPNTIFAPLSEEENGSESFLHAWQKAHAAVKRHLYTSTHHPHYVNVHLSTGSHQAFWIDSLGAFYPGLLTLAGELDEAIETHLLYTALWTRYSALPERWSVAHSTIEGDMGHWIGRPEFIESTYHLYRATRDPWYLHVGEMVLEDIKRRCKARCGWSGLKHAATGEHNDRMESFFLGETAKYLYLLFDGDHPLNTMDAAYVFTTEGHPLMLPRASSASFNHERRMRRRVKFQKEIDEQATCPAPPTLLPLTISATAARPDIFHAGSLVGLHQIQDLQLVENGNDGATKSSIQGHHGSSNYTYYPWTLPAELQPSKGFCPMIPRAPVFTIEFPSNPILSSSGGLNLPAWTQSLTRVENQGLLIKSLSGIKLAMVQEEPSHHPELGWLEKGWRVTSAGVIPLGRDEKVFVERSVLGAIADPSFHRIRNPSLLDIVIQLEEPAVENTTSTTPPEAANSAQTVVISNLPNAPIVVEDMIGSDNYRLRISSFIQQITSAVRNPVSTLLPQPEAKPEHSYVILPAIAPTGKGAAPIIEAPEAPNPSLAGAHQPLTWKTAYFADTACMGKLPDESVRSHHIIVMRRGGCSFSEKLANVPSFAPSRKGFQFLIMVSDDEDANEEDGFSDAHLIRPLLDEHQRTPSGLLRHHQISMALVGGGEKTYGMLQKAKSVGLRRRYHVECNGLTIGNLLVV